MALRSLQENETAKRRQSPQARVCPHCDVPRDYDEEMVVQMVMAASIQENSTAKRRQSPQNRVCPICQRNYNEDMPHTEDGVRIIKFEKKKIRYRRMQSIAMKEGTPHDLEQVCYTWEQQQNRKRQESECRDAEGVLINCNKTDNKLDIAVVGGHYDEGKQWKRLGVAGWGGFCNVFLCKDLNTGALFCLKEYREQGKDIFGKAMNEVKVWLKLDHDSICKLVGAVRVTNQCDNEVKIFMEYIHGPTLARLLKKQKKKELPGCKQERLALIPAVKFLVHLLSGVNHQHKKGISHNDIRSENILIEEKPEKLKIIDYNSSHLPQHTDDQDINTDIVDVLKVFYEMLTGVMLTGKSEELCEQNPPIIPDSLRCPARLIGLFEKAWKDPQWRKSTYLQSEAINIYQALEIENHVEMDRSMIQYITMDYYLELNAEEFPQSLWSLVHLYDELGRDASCFLTSPIHKQDNIKRLDLLPASDVKDSIDTVLGQRNTHKSYMYLHSTIFDLISESLDTIKRKFQMMNSTN